MPIIQETLLKDIVDLISDTQDLLDKQDKMIGNGEKVFRSITRNANNLILVFPVLCTKGITIETASMLSKAIEKKCVVLLELLFASIQIVDTVDLQDYISRFHSNISIGDKITVDDFISLTDTLESAIGEGYIKVTDTDAYEQFKKGMREFNNIAKIAFNENSLSDFSCHRNINGYETILEKIIYSSDDPYGINSIGNDNVRYIKNSTKRKNLKPIASKKLKTGSKDEVITRGYDKDRRDLVRRLSDSDVKKANELIPTKVMVDFYSKDASVKFESGIIGVKCKIYTVDSLELIERISTKYADSNWVRELVRASTGEISFWRDFVFALDRAKVDAINSSKRGSTAKMWKVLERRATKNRLSKWKANRADSAPITTLIVSQDEAEYLKKDYDIDLENRKIAIKLMESYNLMGLVIVDEPAETASFIWDEGNDAQYDTLSFTSLERESSDKNYKKVINLMTKISR